MIPLLRSLIRMLIDLGVEPGDSDVVRVRKAVLAVAGVLTSIALIGMLGPLYLFFHEVLVGLIYIGFGLFVLGNLALYRWWHKDYRRCALVIALAALPAHLASALAMGGFSHSQGVILWGLFFPVLGSLVFFNRRQAVFWFAAYLLNIAVSIYLEPWLTPHDRLPPVVARTLLVLNLTVTAVLALGMMAYFVSQRDHAFGLLRLEQAKSDRLLLNVLPAEIAAILKDNNRTIADHYEHASILFADVVNFTTLSAEISPIELVDILNAVFSAFDALTEIYGLEKIKTIGDCYMVAAGVPRPAGDHAEKMVRMALEMRRLVGEHTFGGRQLDFRIGINSGPVVAGVIGQKKFIYDLWGDAVNVASRMESHGHGGVIQITRATYDLVAERFVCESRGLVPVKGKGPMEVWHVMGERAE